MSQPQLHCHSDEARGASVYTQVALCVWQAGHSCHRTPIGATLTCLWPQSRQRTMPVAYGPLGTSDTTSPTGQLHHVGHRQARALVRGRRLGLVDDRRLYPFRIAA